MGKLTKIIRNSQTIYEAIPAPGAIMYNGIPRKILAPFERKIAEEVVKTVKKGVILDIGSGTGYLAIEIAKRAPDIQVYGVDLSRKMVEIAVKHARGIKNVKFLLGNAADLPFEEGSVDFIVSTGSLHHWKTPVRIFNEIYRVLKRGNKAWIYDGCPEAVKRERYGFSWYFLLKKLVELHGFTKEEYETKIRKILEKSKFEEYKMEPVDIWMKITLRKS